MLSFENLLIYANIFIGLVVAYENVIFYKKTRMKNSWHWIKIFYALIGLYWAGVYVYRLLIPINEFSAVWHYVFIRPGITVTLSAIAASAIMRMKAHKE